MVTNLKLITLTFTMALTLAIPQLSHAMETGLPDEDEKKVIVKQVTEFSNMPWDMRKYIIKQAIFNQCINNKNPVNLALVCKEWRDLIQDEMKVNNLGWKAWYGVVGHEDIYQTFLNGVLVYRPHSGSDEGMIELKISDLSNPLEGTFDLSKCGDSGKELSISTGYRKKTNPENREKDEIWLTPRFVIEKKKKTSAAHLEPIMVDWIEENAPVGILWNLGNWQELSWSDYLTSHSLDNISNKNFYQLGQGAQQPNIIAGDYWPIPSNHHLSSSNFMFICKSK